MKLLALQIFFLASSFAFAEDSECTGFLALEKDMARKLPMQVDEATTVVEFSVNCMTRTIKYVKHLSVPVSTLAEGFEQRKQRQYINLHCNQQGLATMGWTSRDYIYDKDLVLVMKLEATPSMCDDQ